MPERVREDPVGFFRADDEARVHAIFVQPLGAEGYSLKKSGRIADQRTGQRNISQHRREMAGRRGINRFGKQQRTGRRRVLQRLLIKTAGILHAAGLQADDQAQAKSWDRGPPAIRPWLPARRRRHSA